MIVDSHTHIFPPFFSQDRGLFFDGEPDFRSLYVSPTARLAGREDLLRNMDEEGVDKSVVFGFPWRRAEHFRRHNDYILESVGRHPDRLIGLCCFSPLCPEAPGEAERCLASGLSGVGELAIYDREWGSADEVLLGEVMDLCGRFEVPVLFHANEPVGHMYPGKAPTALRDLYAFLRRFPRNRIALAHWGGGLFFYGLMKKEVREVLGNTWFDTAASPFLYRPAVYRVAGEIIGYDRILFGSDFPLLGPGRYLREMESEGLSLDAMRMIRGDNAARLFGLSESRTNA
ncbi:MAG: amidohydrolase [Deltaproteobacteria bacterium]|nr:amidohydrolase [Deltaproteobacteria bacterium]